MTLIELVTMKKEYIRRKSMGIFNMDYPKMVKDSGYTFEQVDYAEAELYLKTLNPEIVYCEKGESESIKEYCNNSIEKILTILSNKSNAVVYDTHSVPMLWYGDKAEIIIGNCEKFGVIPIYTPLTKSAMITIPEDADFSIFMNDPSITVYNVIMNKLLEYIKTRTRSTAVISKNDILVDNRKVIGSDVYIGDKYAVVSVHISFKINISMIKEICNKASSVKSPAPLAEFGNFNRKDFYKEMLSWFN